MDKLVFLAQWERFNRIVHDIVHRMNGSIAAEHGLASSSAMNWPSTRTRLRLTSCGL